MQPVVIRASRTKWIILATLAAPLTVLVAAACSLVLPAALSAPRLAVVAALLLLTMAVLGGALLLFVASALRPGSLVIDETGLSLRSVARTTFWRWGEIADVTTRRSPQGALTFVVLTLTPREGRKGSVSLPVGWEVGPDALRRAILAAKAHVASPALAGVISTAEPVREALRTTASDRLRSLARLGALAALPLLWIALRLGAGHPAVATGTPHAVRPDLRFGALAVSLSRPRGGASWRYGDRFHAVERAMRECRVASGADDCLLKSVVRDQCAAYAAGDTPGHEGLFEGERGTAVVNGALASCRATGGRGCAVVVTTCADDP